MLQQAQQAQQTPRGFAPPAPHRPTGHQQQQAQLAQMYAAHQVSHWTCSMQLTEIYLILKALRPVSQMPHIVCLSKATRCGQSFLRGADLPVR